jgi:ferredoxin
MDAELGPVRSVPIRRDAGRARHAPAAVAEPTSRRTQILPAHGRPLAPGETRLEVDRITCDGYGMCAELLPELIELDDWGYPIVHSTVPAHLTQIARRAIDVCPVFALRLRSGR